MSELELSDDFMFWSEKNSNEDPYKGDNMGKLIDRMYETAKEELAPEDQTYYYTSFEEITKKNEETIISFIKASSLLYSIGEMSIEECLFAAFVYGAITERENIVDDKLKNVSI